MATTMQAEALRSVHPRISRLAVATIFFTNAVVIANWIARIPDVKQHLSLSEATLGIALLSMAAGALASQVATGWLMSRFGSRRVTILMALFFCAAATLPGAAASLPLLMLALFVFGAGNGGLDVAMNSQAALVEQQYGRPIMVSFHGLWSVGGLVGASLGGLIATQGVLIGTHLLAIAVVAIIIMLIATRGLIVDSGSHATSEPGFVVPPRSLLPLGVVAFGALFCEGAVGDWGAVYLRDNLGSTASLAATGYAIFSLLMTIGRLTGDWLTLRLGPTLMVRGGGALITAGIGVLLLSPTPLGAIAGFGLIGAGGASIFPLVLSAASRTPNIASGTAIAAMATAGYTGFLVGPPLIGSVAEVLTLRGALGVLAFLGVLIVLFGTAVQRPKQA